MPTNANGYNSRVTDEALEKRFRDTFRAQGGAELVDDLYAQGVIVPVVDFTAAATGQQLSQNLQTAWDFTTGRDTIVGSGTSTAISNSGFWLFWGNSITANDTAAEETRVQINDGTTTKDIWYAQSNGGISLEYVYLNIEPTVVFLRAGDSLQISSTGVHNRITILYRQIATVSGDLVNPSGFTSS